MMLDLYSIVNNKLLGKGRKSLGNKIFFQSEETDLGDENNRPSEVSLMGLMAS